MQDMFIKTNQKIYFQHNMDYGDFEDLPTRRTSDITL